MAAVGSTGNGSTDHIGNLARGGVFNLAGAVVSSITNILLVLLVTRQVAPDVAGSLFAATSVFLIGATIARLGTTTGLVYWIARLRALGQFGSIDRSLRYSLLPVTVVSLVLAVTMSIAAEPLGRLVGGATPDMAVNFLRSLAFFLPLAALSDALLAATRGYGFMRPTVLIERVGRPIAQVLLTISVLTLSTSGLLAVAWSAPYLASACIAAIWLADLRRKPSPTVDEPPTVFTPATFWRYTAPRSVGTLVQLALQRLDIVLVAALAGPAEAAIYTAATRFLVVGQLVNHAVSTAVEPQLAGVLATGHQALAGRLYQLSTGWLILVTWPLYLLAMAFPGELTAQFGDGYGAGAPVVVILASAMLLATACGMVSATLNMAGKTVWTLVNAILALMTMIALDLLLIPSYGIVGAAIAWAVAIVVNNLLPLFQLRHAFALHPFGPESRRGIVLAFSIVGVAPITLAIIGAPTTIRAGVALASVLVFILFVIKWRHQLAIDTLLSAALRRSTVKPEALT